MSTADVRMHRESIAAASSYVARLTDADLERPTPCELWNMRQLLEHMVGQHVGFAEVVRTGSAGAAAYRPLRFTTTSWQTSVDDLISTFAAADLGTKVVQAELHPTHPLPTTVVVQAQLLDTVVHTWDVAAALGESYTPEPHVVDAVLRVAEPIPDDEQRDLPGAAFAHALATDGTTWERTLALLGRAPGWVAPT